MTEDPGSPRPARELNLECYGVRVRIVDAADTGICPRVAELLPPTPPSSPFGTPDVCYVVTRVGSDAAEPLTYQVVREGEVCFSAPTLAEAAGWICREVDAAVAVNSRDLLFVHAGVVGWRGRAILVPGRSMTGKSTLVSALVHRGATYYSDEFAVLDAAGQVHPYARRPVLRGRPGADADRAAQACRGAVGRTSLPVSLIVSMPYHDVRTWCPKVVTGARAALPLVDNTLVARAQPERTLRLAARLAPTLVTLEGARPDAEVAAGRILEFLDSLVDAGSSARLEESRIQARLDRARAMRAAGLGIAPARFVRFDDVLDPDEHARLLEYVWAHEATFATSGVMASDGTSHVDPRFRKSGTIMKAHEPSALLGSRLRGLLPHVRRELGLSWFPLGRTELQMAVHQDGDFFGAHTDNGNQEVAGRHLTCVYYFHGRPKRFSGGELLIHDTETRDGRPMQTGTHVRVEPADNSAVFFPSSLLHEVRPVHRETDAFADSRFSVNVWFWVGSFPASVTADALRQSAG